MTDDYRARLIAARQRLGLTPRQMAERLLTPRQTYEQWESGARRTPGVAIVAAEALKRATRVTINELAEILPAAIAADETLGDVARRLGCNNTAILVAERRLGVRLRRSRYRVPREKIELALRLADGTLTAREIAAAAGIKENVVRNAVARAGGPATLRKRDTRGQLSRDIEALLRSGMRQAEIARSLGVSKQRVSQIAQQTGFGRKHGEDVQ